MLISRRSICDPKREQQSALVNILPFDDDITAYLPNDPLSFLSLEMLRQLNIFWRQTSVLVNGRGALMVLVLQFVLHDCLSSWKGRFAEYKAR
jgi:hypothetical protein